MSATILGSASMTRIGAWSTTTGGYTNETVYYIAGGSGTNKATWTFTGLTSGAYYALALTWGAFSNRGTNCTWNILDSNGTTVLATGTIDQTKVAQGLVTGGVAFQWLNAPVTPSGTSLSVQWTDHANSYVTADAALLEPTSDSLNCTALTTGNWSSSGTWLPYVPCVPFAITGCANNGSGLVRITTAATPWVTGNKVNVLGVLGTTEANGSWTVTVISSTTADLQGSTFTNTYISGGSAFQGNPVTIGSGVVVTLNSGAADANGLIIVGGDPGTNGTPAIQSTPVITYGTAGGQPITAAHGVTVGTGLKLRLRGDLTLQGSSTTPYGFATLTMSQGSSLIMDPPSGQTYVFRWANSAAINCSGATNTGVWPDTAGGNHVVVTTDLSRGGNAAYNVSVTGTAPITGNWFGGFMVCAFTDFSNLGNTTIIEVGVVPFMNNGVYHTASFSMTNCTFNASNYWALCELGTTQSCSFTFSNNLFTNSIAGDLFGGSTCVAGFSLVEMASVTISNNSFDYAVLFDNAPAASDVWNVTGNAFIGGLTAGNATTAGGWTTGSQFSGNLVVITAGGGNPLTMGSCTNNYFIHTAASPTGYLGFIANPIVTANVFESAVASASNAWVLYAGHAGTLKAELNLIIPGEDGNGSGYLIYPGGIAVTFTVEHNLQWGNTGEAMIALGQGGAAAAAQVTSCRSNLLYDPSSNAGTYAVQESGSSTYTKDAVTVAGYNGYYNPTTGTVKSSAGGVSTSGVPGYNQIEVTAAGVPPANSQVGTGDFTANPNFLDSTRCLAKWGNVTQGTANTYTAALAALAANPGLISGNTGLLNWVRAGFAPTNPAFLNTTYGGDALTTDANGNPLGGTIGPMGTLLLMLSPSQIVSDRSQSRRKIWAE